MQTIQYFSKRLLEEPRPIRFLISRILFKTGLCRLFKIKIDRIVLSFFPTSLSMSLWLDSESRNKDVDILKSILNQGDTYIDVGANIGHLALEASVLIGDGGNVFAFEAHPQTALYCQKNIILNKRSNVKVLPVGLSDQVQLVSISNKVSDDQNQVNFNNSGLTILTLRKLGVVLHKSSC